MSCGCDCYNFRDKEPTVTEEPAARPQSSSCKDRELRLRSGAHEFCTHRAVSSGVRWKNNLSLAIRDFKTGRIQLRTDGLWEILLVSMSVEGAFEKSEMAKGKRCFQEVRGTGGQWERRVVSATSTDSDNDVIKQK